MQNYKQTGFLQVEKYSTVSLLNLHYVAFPI